jgi:hypothetical protein
MSMSLLAGEALSESSLNMSTRTPAEFERVQAVVVRWYPGCSDGLYQSLVEGLQAAEIQQENLFLSHQKENEKVRRRWEGIIRVYKPADARREPEEIAHGPTGGGCDHTQTHREAEWRLSRGGGIAKREGNFTGRKSETARDSTCTDHDNPRLGFPDTFHF